MALGRLGPVRRVLTLPFLCALMACGLARTVTGDIGTAQRGGWDPTLLQQWVEAVEQHVPGASDRTLEVASHWSSDNVRQLWVDVQVLLAVVAKPTDTKFQVAPMDEGPALSASYFLRRSARRPPLRIITFQTAERQHLDDLAARARRLGARATLKRGVIVHTDLATMAADVTDAATSGSPARAPVKMLVGDGDSLGVASLSRHWDLARMLVSKLAQEPVQDPFARDWYRATIALGQSVEWFDGTQLAHGLQAFPNDPVLNLLAGCQHEAFASPLFQAFSRAYRRAPRTPGIGPAWSELDEAERFFRRALAADERAAETRVRLGHVLTLKGRHADAVKELELATSARLDPIMAYHTALFLGQTKEALGDVPAARASYQRAVQLVPEARIAPLALARLAHERGDRGGQVEWLERAIAPANGDTADPWWAYRHAQGRQSAAWMNALRQLVRQDAR